MMIPGSIVALAFLFAVLVAAETMFPLRPRARPRWRRVGVNVLVTAVAFGAGALTVRPTSMALMDWLTRNPFGLLGAVDLPRPVEFVVGFLLLDLTFYYWHRANHRTRFLWRFHNVHHLDQDLDVSTSFRFHFCEVAISTAFRAAQVLVIGVPLGLYLAYESVFQAATMFHHSNVRLPLGFERVMNLVVVTPRMHGIHHSSVRDEADTNYSVIFRWWDWLNSSLKLGVPQGLIRAGVPAYSRPSDNRFWNLLRLPFLPQRKYWWGADTRGASGSSGETARMAA